MKFIALACVLSAVPVRAQVASAPSAWAKPVADVLSAAGPARIDALGSPSLSSLSRPDVDSRLPLVAAPRILSPLAEAVEAQGLDPKAFEALPLHSKLASLSLAGRLVESRAATAYGEALAAAAKSIDGARADEVVRKFSRALGLSPYLSAEQSRKLTEAQSALARNEEIARAFQKDIVGKIAAGEISGINLVGRDDGGWYTIDDPRSRYPTLHQLYAARSVELAAAPGGPWTKHQVLALVRSTVQPGVVESFSGSPEETAFDTRRRLIKSLWASYDSAWSASLERFPGLGRAFARLRDQAADVSDVVEIERLYAEALRATTGAATSAWLRATVVAGGAPVPSWEKLKVLKQETQRRSRRPTSRAGKLREIPGASETSAIDELLKR